MFQDHFQTVMTFFLEIQELLEVMLQFWIYVFSRPVQTIISFENCHTKKHLSTHADSDALDQLVHPRSLIWKLHCLLICQWDFILQNSGQCISLIWSYTVQYVRSDDSFSHDSTHNIMLRHVSEQWCSQSERAWCTWWSWGLHLTVCVLYYSVNLNNSW